MKAILSITLGILLISTSIEALAQTSTPTTTDEVATTTEAVATSTPVLEVEQPATPPQVVELDARTQERITNLAANLSNRLDATIARLQNISTRLESRANKIASGSADVSEALNTLRNANDSLQQAEQRMSGIDAQIAQVVGGDSPIQQWSSAKNTYQTAIMLVRAAHNDLNAAVSLLKNPPPIPAEPVATTTSDDNI